MRGIIYVIPLLAAWLGLACASSVDVRFDERADFSRYHTWSWLPDAASRVDAPHADPARLDAQLARLIEEQLGQHGYERAAERADFFVSYRLALHRHAVEVEVPRAPYLLSSYSSSPSYWIEGSEVKKRIFEDLQLVVRVAGPDGRTTWQAALKRRLEDGSGLRLDDLIVTLLERFPAHRNGSRPRTPPADGGSSRGLTRLQIDCPVARTLQLESDFADPAYGKRVPGLLPCSAAGSSTQRRVK